jgi:hypothetical protein
MDTGQMNLNLSRFYLVNSAEGLLLQDWDLGMILD